MRPTTSCGTNAILPLLRHSTTGCILNVSSKLASLALAERICQGDLSERYFNLLAYNTPKAALNAVDPGRSATDINGHIGDRPPSAAAKIIVRFATLPNDGPTGSFLSEQGPRPW